ncbi:uncharacterized protein METZ01_LOCUS472785, partial [marine metagenome]
MQGDYIEIFSWSYNLVPITYIMSTKDKP